MKTFSQSVHDYETWLRGQLGADLVEGDLDEKHEKMKSNGFVFLRATYWRWAETIFSICPELAAAPQILAIGDIHLENFGTWRDSEGRLVWGVNDFDDAAVMPYVLDLVRLAASAILARSHGDASPEDLCAAILDGYAKGLAGPRPYILERDNAWLRDALVLSENGRDKFWSKFAALEIGGQTIAPPYRAALAASFPAPGAFNAMPRSAGTGSLGRPRFAGLMTWRGGPVLREVKAMLPSAWSLSHDPAMTDIRAVEIAGGAERAVDPHYRLDGSKLLRRLSPNTRKIEAEDKSGLLLSPKMLKAMGFEIANCHFGDGSRIPPITSDFAKRGGDWLRSAAGRAADQISGEQRDYAAT